MKKSHSIQFLYTVLISISIGLLISLLSGGSLIKSAEAYLWNAGYSISLGIPLFFNGFVFEKVASRFVDWIRKPIRSIFAALTLHFTYTSIVIFSVNWFWFILILKQERDDFWVPNRWTIISEYIVFIVMASVIYAMSFLKRGASSLKKQKE